MSKIISFKEGKKNLLENRKEKQIPISQKTINQRETKKATPQSTEPEMGICFSFLFSSKFFLPSLKDIILLMFL